MTFNLLFNTVIYSIILGVVICAIRVCAHSIKSQRNAKNQYTQIKTYLEQAKHKGRILKEHVSLVNNFEKNLFYRFFEINKQLIEIQRLLLKSN